MHIEVCVVAAYQRFQQAACTPLYRTTVHAEHLMMGLHMSVWIGMLMQMRPKGNLYQKKYVFSHL